jgi:hypothetical protein
MARAMIEAHALQHLVRGGARRSRAASCG